jgi:hydrogenase maturation protease
MTRHGGDDRCRSVVIAGLGNEYRHDDAVGVIVSERAAEATGARSLGPLVDPLELLGRWDGASCAIVVDALRSGAAPGTIRVLDVSTPGPDRARDPSGDEMPAFPPRKRPVTSTHGIDVVGALRIARAVGGAPRRVVLVGIEGEDFSSGIGLTSRVGSAMPEAVHRVVTLVEEATPCA